MARIRIFKITTETPDYSLWSSYKVAAETAEQALAKVKYGNKIGERLLGVELLARTNPWQN